MNRIADAFGRALFPNRYAPGSSAEQPATLPSDGLNLAIGAGVYRLVNGVEALLDALRRRGPSSGTAAGRVPTAARVGCG